MNRVSTLLLLAACTTSACIDPAPRTASVASALVEDTSFGSNPGKLRMYSYSPTGVPDSAPLVVALHGCTQSASAYVGAGWNELADLAKFHVVYAEQQAANNAEECFDWFTTADITRDAGEALSIKQMVDAMKAKVSIDGTRVFVTGLSAGGAMTAVMLATYPDVFAAGAVMSGVPYGCAASAVESLSCENPGVNKTASAWADPVRNADPGYGGPYPRISIWQGSSDFTVAPADETSLVEQWTSLHGLSQTPTSTNTVGPATHNVYEDAQQNVIVESYLIANMGHGTALQVGYAPAGGCGQAGAYLLDVGICSTYWAADFFGLLDGNAIVDGGAAIDLAPPSDSDLGATGGSDGGMKIDNNGADGGGTGASPSRGCNCAINGGSHDASITPFTLLLLAIFGVAIVRRARKNR